MSDPLGFISRAGGTGPNRPIDPASAGAGGAEGGPSFKDVLMKNLAEVNRLQEDARAAMEDFAAGRRTDLEGVVGATQKADLAFQTLLAVRNKVMRAYEDLQQIRV